MFKVFNPFDLHFTWSCPRNFKEFHKIKTERNALLRFDPGFSYIYGRNVGDDRELDDGLNQLHQERIDPFDPSYCQQSGSLSSSACPRLIRVCSLVSGS